MPDSLTIGNAEVISVPDGPGDLEPFPVDFPWLRYRDLYPNMFRPDGSWDVHNGCYIVRVDGRTVLVDTGMGPWPYKPYGSVEGQLDNSFSRAGIEFADIDIVFLTHGHPDHVGWNVLKSGEIAFPNARYLLNRADWQEFTGRQKTPNYVRRSLQPVMDAGQFDLLDGETAITESLTAIETPGHTPGSMSLLLYSGGHGALFVGDVLPLPLYVTDPESGFQSDADIEQGNRTRLAVLDRIEQEGLTLVSPHFHEPGWGTVVRVEGRRIFRAGK